MLKDVRFRFQHDGCWLQEATERHPGVMLVASSVYSAGDSVVMNLTVHADDLAVVDVLEKEWTADERIHTIRRLHEGPRGVRFHVTYSTPKSIFHHILEYTPVSIGTIRVAGGEEHYSIVGSTPDVQGLMRVLATKGKLGVEAIRDVAAPDEATSDAPWGDLTDKQLEALVLAYLGGYYQWPRDRSASTLAEELGLSSSAFLDHLRHAEAKLVSGIMEDMRTREPGRIEALRARREKRDLSLPVASR